MVRFGIAGFGLHAAKRLMPGFALATRATAVALSRRSLQAARESAEKYEIPHAFDSTESLCRCPEVDAVFVATPDALHLADVLTAIRHGKPVLVEKPMAMNAAEARQMVEAASQAGVPLGVAQIFRFAASVQRVRERIAQGELGQVLYARSEFCYPGGGSPRRWIDDPSLACGGPMADVGVHCIDTLRFVLDDEVEAVSARTAQQDSKLDTAAILQLRFSRGALGMVAVSSRSQYRTPFEVAGEHGSLGGHNLLTVDAPVALELRRGLEEPQVEQLSNVDAYAAQVDAFAAMLRGGAPFPSMGEVGLRNQLILDAAYRSARSQCWEDVE